MTVFFFFFVPASSPHYEDPRFQHFCDAFAHARAQFPSMTLSALRTFLTVAGWSAGSGIGYDEVAHRAGIDYVQAAHHLEQLSDGRAGQGGLGLTARREETDRRFRTVTITDLGAALARRFILPGSALVAEGAPQTQHATLRDALQRGPLQATQFAADAMPGIALGTFTVLLEITRQEAKFAYEGRPAKEIAEQLGISNLAKHISILAQGLKGREGFGLVETVPHPVDRRIKLPRLTAQGHRIVSGIAARVCDADPLVPRRAKSEKVADLEGPDLIEGLNDDDFDLTFDLD